MQVISKKRYENLKIHYIKKDLYPIGISEIQAPLGNRVQVYDAERSICDIVLYREKIDGQIYVDALSAYFKRKDRDLRKLIKYSRQFGIEEEIKRYVEVLS